MLRNPEVASSSLAGGISFASPAKESFFGNLEIWKLE